MSWRDNSSSSTNGTQDGSGGSMSGGGSVSGTGGGGFGGMRGQTTGGRGGYTFRGVPGSRNIGNWNTGGPVVGTGSLSGGIVRSQVALPRAHPRPTGFNAQPPVVPPVVPPITPPIFSGWPTVPAPPQQVPSYVQPRSVPVTNMPNSTHIPYRPEGDAFSRSWGLGDKGNRVGGLTGNF